MYFQVVGGPCGYHGPYTFYKGIRISPTLPGGYGQAFNEPKFDHEDIKTDINTETFNSVHTNILTAGRNGW